LFKLLEGDEFVASIQEGLINPATYLNAHKLVAFVTMYPGVRFLLNFLSAFCRHENIFRHKLKRRMNLPHNMCISESKELHAKFSEFEPAGYGLRKSEGTLHCGFAGRRDKLPKELATLEIASCSQRQSNEWTSAI
jgi:hypothetical protein